MTTKHKRPTKRQRTASLKNLDKAMRARAKCATTYSNRFDMVILHMEELPLGPIIPPGWEPPAMVVDNPAAGPIAVAISRIVANALFNACATFLRHTGGVPK